MISEDRPEELCAASVQFEMASADSKVATVSEYEKLAKQKLSKMVYDYYASGAEDMWTVRENVRAFQNIRLTPQNPVDVGHVDTSTEVLGFKISMPIMIAPLGLQRMAHPDGELAIARAASTASTIMVLSSSATTTLEDVDNTGPGVRFLQLYVFKNREGTAQVVRRAERAGYKAIVLTGDSPYIGRREADIKNRFTLPPTLALSNYEGMFNTGVVTEKGSSSVLGRFVSTQFDQALTWKDIMWLKGITSLPILIKGVLTAEDARLAVQSGVAGIMVSNHGGRQLDYAPATIDVLGEVVEAVQGKVPVFCDGGIRHGTDVFKALALGAVGVFIGRPVVYGLAAEGGNGVRNILQMMNDEFKLAMSLAGCHRVQDIRRGHILTLDESNTLSKL